MRSVKNAFRGLWVGFLAGALLFGAAAGAHASDKGGGSAAKPVVITNEGQYYRVTMDYTGMTHREMGRALALEIVKAVPEYEILMDGLLKTQLDLMGAIEPEIQRYYPNYKYKAVDFQEALRRARIILKNVPREYADEIQGMQDVFNYGADSLGDQRLSADELLVIQLFPDALRPWGCSASAAFGASSETGKTILGRNLDWFSGPMEIASRLHAVTTIKDGEKSSCNVNVLGMLFAGSEFTKSKVFGALLDADNPTIEYPSDLAGKRSYGFDLRYALEHFTTMREVADFMASKDYAFDHLIFLADENSAEVVENDIGSQGRGVRTAASALRQGLGWGIPDTIATVNDFRLPNNYFAGDDNSNNERWESYVNRYTAALAQGKIGVDAMEEIAGYVGPQSDGNDEHGAIYLASSAPYYYSTSQSIVLRMDTLEMWVCFAPVGGPFVAKPIYFPVPDGLETR